MEQKKKRDVAGICKKVLVIVIAAFLLYISGCGKVEDYLFQMDRNQCDAAEAKILLMNYQKEYSSSYGFDLWNYDEKNGQKMESYLKELTLTQLAEIYTLDLAADAQKVTLSKEEENLLSEASQTYYQGLSEAEKEYLGASEDTIHDLYERYGLAQKICADLTEEERSELLQKYQSEADSTCNAKQWEAVTIDHSLQTEGKSFLAVYTSYFPEEESEAQK